MSIQNIRNTLHIHRRAEAALVQLRSLLPAAADRSDPLRAAIDDLEMIKMLAEDSLTIDQIDTGTWELIQDEAIVGYAWSAASGDEEYRSARADLFPLRTDTIFRPRGGAVSIEEFHQEMCDELGSPHYVMRASRSPQGTIVCGEGEGASTESVTPESSSQDEASIDQIDTGTWEVLGLGHESEPSGTRGVLLVTDTEERWRVNSLAGYPVVVLSKRDMGAFKSYACDEYPNHKLHINTKGEPQDDCP